MSKLHARHQPDLLECRWHLAALLDREDERDMLVTNAGEGVDICKTADIDSSRS
jgi:hypothetical protein